MSWVPTKHTGQCENFLPNKSSTSYATSVIATKSKPMNV